MSIATTSHERPCKDQAFIVLLAPFQDASPTFSRNKKPRPFAPTSVSPSPANKSVSGSNSATL